MKRIKINFGGITKVQNTLIKDVSRIIVNGGGGLGGSREEIFGQILFTKENGFIVVKEIISGDEIEINYRFIGTIKKVNMTKLYFEHTNSNFPSGKRTEWYTHKVNTEVEFVDSDRVSDGTVENGMRDESLDLKHIHTDDMRYI